MVTGNDASNTMKGLVMMHARDYLKAIYLDYINNYLTVDKYAEHNGLTAMQSCRLLDLAKEVFNSNHPEE